MKNKAAVLLLISLFLGWLVSCGDSAPETSSNSPTAASDSASCAAPAVRPQDSEMTLVMRNLFDSMRVFRESAKKGENRHNLSELVTKVHSAQLTDPDQRGIVFQSYAKGFQLFVDSLQAKEHPTSSLYNQVVKTCLTLSLIHI